MQAVYAPFRGPNAVTVGHRNAGFTLMELMVVLAVLAVLVALLLPALGRARESGRTLQCQNNLHQLGVAMQIYSDQAGNYPQDLVTTVKPMMGMLPSKGDPVGIWRCPSWSTKNEILNPNLMTDVRRRLGSDYEINWDGFGNVRQGGTSLGLLTSFEGMKFGAMRRESDIATPSDMIAMGEMWSVRIVAARTQVISLSLATPESQYVFLRHQKKANMLFCDGHLETDDRKSLISMSDEVQRRWNFDNQPHHETPR
ncbi:MAG: prepilin-type N-terminal cleavage/methylation protein [Verrucomicrobiales bacterium]|jgi:prepilin-type N-terminal cleavage/methylation domain-containing protein/prepilin-type processing-associated H-X9-DG protein|nr:prepilin-type N-terminal cleavage/methylation protein [Verrucomicrobiales bacterium]